MKSLFETPFPVLLNTILREGRTCTLELKLRQLEKRITFEDGSPVACSSNLLHETLGKYLVEKGKLTEAQYQSALAESITTGQQMGALLVQKQLIAPFELYRQLQANLAHKILDCFRWSDATYRILSDTEPVQSALKMNSAQLILTGTSNLLPFDVVATHLTFADDQRFAAVNPPPASLEDLRLAGRDARLLQALKGRPTFEELMKHLELDVEPMLRKLYALVVLGLADFSETVPDSPQFPLPASASSERASEPGRAEGAGQGEGQGEGRPTPTVETPRRDEDPSTRDALIAAFLDHRSQDPFTLLGVPEDAPPVAIRRAFLDLEQKYSPLLFTTPDLKEKAEILLVAWARAFSVLADPEQNALWKQRRRAAEARKQADSKGPSSTRAAQSFRIRTDLLDARSQFDQARERLASDNARGALEYFDYACDIEPRPLYRAWRAWCRYLIDPDRHARLALEDLTELGRDPAANDEVFGFAGEIHRKLGQYDKAEESFRRAFKLNPLNRTWAEALPQVVKAQKR